jgi:hypothetical protein
MNVFHLIPGTLNDTTQLNCLLLLQNDTTVLEIMLKKVTVMVLFKILNQYLEKKLKPKKHWSVWPVPVPTSASRDVPDPKVHQPLNHYVPLF